MNIILTDIANLVVFLIPVVPPSIEISAESTNETADTLSGNVRIMKNPALRKISWSSFFPVNKDYGFVPYNAHSNGWVYVSFLESMRRFKLPIRIIGTTRKKAPMFNFLASIDKFSWSLDKAGDINYSISLTEFKERFFEFVDRDIRVLKYIAGYIKNKDKLNALKNTGLIIKENL